MIMYIDVTSKRPLPKDFVLDAFQLDIPSGVFDEADEKGNHTIVFDWDETEWCLCNSGFTSSYRMKGLYFRLWDEVNSWSNKKEFGNESWSVLKNIVSNATGALIVPYSEDEEMFDDVIINGALTIEASFRYGDEEAQLRKVPLVVEC